MSGMQPKAIKGRGALSNAEGRFESIAHIAVDDGWSAGERPAGSNKTMVAVDHSRTVISRNSSPDVPFDQSINPYRGCEHGCVYCFARPSHAYLGLSSGLDFEQKLFYKPNAVEQLKEELAATGYRCKPLAVGTNTDPYQPIEKRYQLMRGILRLMVEARHPITITTKSALIERDLDLLQELAANQLVMVSVSITTLDRDIARKLEPRAAAPKRRLQVLSRLSGAGIPAHVSVAPVIPALTDHEMETILEMASKVGSEYASYTLLRLPWDIKELFREWLVEHAPGRADHVMSLIRQSRQGKEYDHDFATRRPGTGHFAELLASRFRLGCRRYRLNEREVVLATDQFRPPQAQQSFSF